MMQNRYGESYRFEKIDENTYTIVGEIKYWRFGAKEGENTIDWNNLGFVDPSGGPFISPGYLIEGRKVVSIAAVDDKIFFGVE
jgi:hypothetical protein